MREVFTTDGILVVKGTNRDIVDLPDDGLIGPDDSVLVELILRGGNGVVNGSVKGGGVTLSEVVGFNLSSISSKPFPVNLIKIVTLEDETADNTSSIGSP